MNSDSINPIYEKVITDILERQYSIIDDFFSIDQVNLLRASLLQKHEENEFKKAAIGNQFTEKIIKTIRGDFISWIDESTANEAEKIFFNKIDHFTNYLNSTCYLGICQKEFHYALYPKNTFYKRHLDTFQNDDSRKLSIVCYLNSEDWQKDFGGELVIYKDTEEITIYPLKGRMVVFESQLLEHEVKTVVQNRLSITGWLKTRKI
jgi:SM-20-related protein